MFNEFNFKINYTVLYLRTHEIKNPVYGSTTSDDSESEFQTDALFVGARALIQVMTYMMNDASTLGPNG